jgi:hypothetical protein
MAPRDTCAGYVADAHGVPHGAALLTIGVHSSAATERCGLAYAAQRKPAAAGRGASGLGGKAPAGSSSL